MVHYQSYGTPGGEFTPECRAAVVTEVDKDNPEVVGLIALNPTGVFFHPLAFNGGCQHDESKSRGGTWHWPERVGPVDDVLDAL